MNSYLRLIAFAACSCLVAFCDRVPQAHFYEVDGIVSGQLNESLKAPNWHPVYYINSRGLAPDDTRPDSSKALSFSTSISNTGNYSFWILTTTTGNSGSRDTLDITVRNNEQFLVAQFLVEVPGNNQLQWIQAEAASGRNRISMDKSGVYTFSIHPRETEEVQVHKIHMSHDNRVKPFGLGLPSSSSVNLSAADLFREQPVMLPPAWVFKPVIGLEQPSESSEYLSETVGGIWLDVERDDVQNSDLIHTDTGQKFKLGLKLAQDGICGDKIETTLKSGYQFIVTFETPALHCLQEYHDTYQRHAGNDQRSLVFHGLGNGYDSSSKLYPALITPLYQFEWSADREVYEGKLKPGGYRQLIDDISNPSSSLYNTQFLSMPMDYSSVINEKSDWDSQLFIQTIQLSAFLPVMHIVEPKNEDGSTEFFDQISESERELLNFSLNLRSSLFPYHYTHAHYTRQRNESIITGFREHPGQFMYGEAFLVAPVLEKNLDGRIIYFPEGRLWYNYYSGEVYEAGRSWFIETEADRLPLFVKAGSVIPYSGADNHDHLKVEVYAGDAGSFRLVEDDGTTNRYRRAEAARTMFRYNEVQGRQQLTIGAVQAEFEGMTNERSYDLHFKFTDLPQRVMVNDEKIEQTTNRELKRNWRFDDSEQELIINLKDQSKNEKLDIVIIP